MTDHCYDEDTPEPTRVLPYYCYHGRQATADGSPCYWCDKDAWDALDV